MEDYGPVPDERFTVTLEDIEKMKGSKRRSKAPREHRRRNSFSRFIRKATKLDRETCTVFLLISVWICLTSIASTVLFGAFTAKNISILGVGHGQPPEAITYAAIAFVLTITLAALAFATYIYLLLAENRRNPESSTRASIGAQVFRVGASIFIFYILVPILIIALFHLISFVSSQLSEKQLGVAINLFIGIIIFSLPFTLLPVRKEIQVGRIRNPENNQMKKMLLFMLICLITIGIFLCGITFIFTNIWHMIDSQDTSLMINFKHIDEMF